MRCKACNKSIEVSYRYIDEIDDVVLEDMCSHCVTASGARPKTSFFEDYYAESIDACSSEVLLVLGIEHHGGEDSEEGY